MQRKWVRAVGMLVVLLGVSAGLLLLTNPAPQVRDIGAGEGGGAARPYVVKLHARWCPVCMVTKDAWASVQDEYVGRVRLVVFDFTTDATTETSRAQAARLGLSAVFDEWVGATGSVLVLDGASKELKQVLHGNLEPAEYRAAIDATLAGHTP
jgi:thiol-disulfide isomerase/thioredoxin